jgi:hypothetical protein
MRKIIVNPDGINRMEFECPIDKAAESNSEYVVFINFPLQKLLHGANSNFHCTLFACFVFDAVHKLYLQSYIYGSIKVTANLILPHKTTNNFYVSSTFQAARSEVTLVKIIHDK